MKPRNITIGLVQSKVSEDLNNNLTKTEKMIRQAAKKGARIICLQELFQTPYFPGTPEVDKQKYSETIPGKHQQNGQTGQGIRGGNYCANF